MAKVSESMDLWVCLCLFIYLFIYIYIYICAPRVSINGCPLLRVCVVFVGAVALAGADSGLWAVDGGNKMVCSGLLNHSKAELVPARVTAISMKMRPPKAGTL